MVTVQTLIVLIVPRDVSGPVGIISARSSQRRHFCYVSEIRPRVCIVLRVTTVFPAQDSLMRALFFSTTSPNVFH